MQEKRSDRWIVFGGRSEKNENLYIEHMTMLGRAEEWQKV